MESSNRTPYARYVWEEGLHSGATAGWRIGGIYELDFSRNESALPYNNHRRSARKRRIRWRMPRQQPNTHEEKPSSLPDNVFSLNPISIERWKNISVCIGAATNLLLAPGFPLLLLISHIFFLLSLRSPFYSCLLPIAGYFSYHFICIICRIMLSSWGARVDGNERQGMNVHINFV